jgi:putative salt-induced outer membrane protein
LSARQALTVAALFVLSSLVEAQAPAASPLAGKAALGYLATSGNTESTNVNAQIELEVDPAERWRHRFTLATIAASTVAETTAEAYSFAYKAQQYFSAENYFFALLDWKKDRFSGYPEQLSETVGFGRRLVDRARHDLSLEGGFGAKQATSTDGTQLENAIVRGGLEYVFLLSDTAEFSQRVSVERGEDNTYTEAISKISARVIGDVSLVFSYTIKNNSDVPLDVAERDTFSSVALEYAF